jgi:hypothetical protein
MRTVDAWPTIFTIECRSILSSSKSDIPATPRLGRGVRSRRVTVGLAHPTVGHAREARMLRFSSHEMRSISCERPPPVRWWPVTEPQLPLDEQLREIGAQLDWVREYL